MRVNGKTIKQMAREN
jgi:hypothetical protein